MLGHGAIGQFAIGEVGRATAEIITVDKWFQALSQPVRFRPGLVAAQQQAISPPDLFPFVSFSWFEDLSIPALRSRPKLLAGQQQFLAFHPAPSPFVATGWFAPLSEPSRKRPALNPGQNPAFTVDTAVIPISNLSPWFAPLSEPVRKRAGLDAARQQFLASPSRLLPNPSTIGVMYATETGDIFTGGARAWNRVVSGETGLIELAFTGAQIAAIETVPSVGTSGSVETVSAPASGSASPVITSASIAIIIL